MRLIDADKLKDEICCKYDVHDRFEADDVLDLLSNAPTALPWIKISSDDDLPPMDIKFLDEVFSASVLITDGEHVFKGKREKLKNESWWWNTLEQMFHKEDITHWAPLPELPKEDE